MRCPHCKNTLSVSVQILKGAQYEIMTADNLLKVLNKDPRRDVYAGKDGGYFVSYSGGDVHPHAISEALHKGLIKEKWPDRKLECWVLA